MLAVNVIFFSLLGSQTQGQSYQLNDLGSLGGSSTSSATAINNSGQIVGWSYLGNPDEFPPIHAFLYSDGSIQDLGALANGYDSYAYGINNSGQIVGWSYVNASNGIEHAFLYSSGSLQDLGTLVGGGSSSEAYGINNHGQVVGYAQTAAGGWHAFLYSNGSMWDLNNLIATSSHWTLTVATAINDAGQIVGYGINPSGQQGSFLLNQSAPHITLQPTSQTVAIGATVSLAVCATNWPVSYQWYYGTNVLAGATNSTLVLSNIQSSQSGAYTVTVANQTGTVTSSPAMIDVLPGLGINMVPAITVSGTVGLVYQLEYVNAFGPTNAWQSLATLTITNSPQYYFDVSAIGQPTRFYQLVQVP